MATEVQLTYEERQELLNGIKQPGETERQRIARVATQIKVRAAEPAVVAEALDKALWEADYPGDYEFRGNLSTGELRSMNERVDRRLTAVLAALDATTKCTECGRSDRRVSFCNVIARGEGTDWDDYITREGHFCSIYCADQWCTRVEAEIGPDVRKKT